MGGLSRNAHLVLAGLRERYGGAYAGMLELAARFGYFSIDEVLYGYPVSRKQAHDRLRYLLGSGLLQKFESHPKPPVFYALTAKGRQAVKDFGLSEEVSEFQPYRYRENAQRHTRELARSFLALRKILGPALAGWTSEETLRRHAGLAEPRYGDAEGQRIWDAELLIRMQQGSGLVPESAPGVGDSGAINWRCPLELELSLKSPYRYFRQFNSLAYQIYDDLHERQLLPMMIFLCGADNLRRHLIGHLYREGRRWGGCVFYFGLAEQVFEKLAEAPLVRVVGRHQMTVPAREINLIPEVRHENL